MTPGSVIAPMTWLEPPHLGHRLKSMANTRCNRAIQPSGGARTLGWGSSVTGLLATLGRDTMAKSVGILYTFTQIHRVRKTHSRNSLKEPRFYIMARMLHIFIYHDY